MEKSEVNCMAPEFLVVIRGCEFPVRPQKVPRTVPVAVGAVKHQENMSMKCIPP